MKALVIAAHGSRKKESNQEVTSLTERVSERASGSFEIIEHAFLQFADPSLEKKMDDLVEKGATKIVIFPFFIGSGNHILVDIPELIKQAELTYAQVQFEVTRHLGQIEDIADVITREVTG